MFGASLLKLIKFGFHFTGAEFALLMLGCIVSFGLSVIAIKFLMGYIKQHDFKVFGYYRIVLGGTDHSLDDRSDCNCIEMYKKTSECFMIMWNYPLVF